MPGLIWLNRLVPSVSVTAESLTLVSTRGEIQRGSGNRAAAGIRDIDHQVAGNRLAKDGRHTKNHSGQQLRGCFHDASPSPLSAHDWRRGDSVLVDEIMRQSVSAMQYRTYPLSRVLTL